MAINKRIIKSNDEGSGGSGLFNTVLWTGDNVYPRDITDVGFQPDLIWLKARNTSGQTHWLTDVVRGGDKKLKSSDGDAEIDNDALGYISEFLSNGFTINTSASNSQFNDVNLDYVAWCWKAGGAAVLNQQGEIDGYVSANPSAGFSIVSYVNTSGFKTVGHGLSQKPELIFTKNRDLLSDWFVACYVYGKMGATYSFGALNRSDGFYGYNDSTTNNVVFDQSQSGGYENISYCFHSVDGFSKIDYYTGTGVAGNKQTLTFEPSWIMIKDLNRSVGWTIVDNKRGAGKILEANSPSSETTDNFINFLPDGFSFNGGNYNNTGEDWLYMAFA